jgi:hypothetical protein
LSVGRNSHVTVSGFDYRSYCLKMCHFCNENNLGYSLMLERSTLAFCLVLLITHVQESTLQAEG